MFFFNIACSVRTKKLLDKKKIKKKNFARENMKKTPQKVAYLSRNSVVSEIFHLLPNSPNGRIYVPKCVL